MTILLDPDTRLMLSLEDQYQISHWVCHCTNDRVAGCGILFEDDAEWSDGESDETCLECTVVWGRAQGTCPWGCSCDECE